MPERINAKRALGICRDLQDSQDCNVLLIESVYRKDP